MARNVRFRNLGTIEYGAAWALQEELLRDNLAVKAEWYNVQQADRPADIGTVNHLLFCRHPHVYTLGKSGHMENLLVNDARMRDLDVSFYKTNRGGDITYHGPGQLVGYPVLDLELFFTDLGRYMRSLEEAIINTLSFYNIRSGRLQGATGVWLDADIPGRARKICAMGVRCSRWVTIHGFALNINTDLSYFNHIVPCGISDKAVTSIQKELGREIDENETEEILKQEFAKVFNVNLILQTEGATV